MPYKINLGCGLNVKPRAWGKRASHALTTGSKTLHALATSAKLCIFSFIYMDANIEITIGVRSWLFFHHLIDRHATLYYWSGSESFKILVKSTSRMPITYRNIQTSFLLRPCLLTIQIRSPDHHIPQSTPVPQSNIQEYALRTVQLITDNDLSAE